MIWKKLGKIYEIDNDNPFLISHASNPLAIKIDQNIYRFFYTGRASDNKSSVSYVDIDIRLKKIIYDHKIPIITYGDENSFYSHGIGIGNLWEYDNKKYIGFMAWQVKNNEHWRGDIGKFEIQDNSFALNPGILLGTDEEDKISLSYPFILKENDVYKMWYGSTIDWTSENGEMIHVIKYATSKNCIEWNKHGISIAFKIGEAQAFSKPSVLKINEKYYMWFSYRSGSGLKYRIGYAISNDGIQWERKQDSGINVGNNDEWDSDMICYPYVFYHEKDIYMVYNGNSFGKTGFGLAKLISL